MSLQIIYGLFGSGKTEHLLQIAEKTWKETDKKVFFIVPEQYSYETEKALAQRLGVISPKTVEVLSFKRLFFYVCNSVGGSLLPRLTDTGREILIAKTANKCIKELKVLGKTAKYRGFSDILVTLFSELKRYNTTPEKLKEITEKIEDGYLKLKMQDIALLYKNYEEEIAGSFTDPEDELTLLSGILREHPDFFADSIVLIDEFEGFTPQEMAVITEMSRGAEEVKITLCTDTLVEQKGKRSLFNMQIKTAAALSEMTERYCIPAEKPLFFRESFKHTAEPAMKHLESNLREGSYKRFEGVPGEVEILFALNLTTELEQIAETIINLTRDGGYRYRDFTVVARNSEDYKNVAESVFARYNLPLYVNRKMPLSEENPAFALISALNIILKKWDYNSVFAYLKTGYGSVSDEECDFIENYIIKTGIRGTGWTNGNPWKYLPKGFDEEKLERLEIIRNKIVLPVKELEEKLKNAPSVRDCIRAVVEFMQAQGFAEKTLQTGEFYRNINPDIADRYRQIYALIIKSLDDIDLVCGENQAVSTEEFAAMLETAFEAHTVGIIPSSADSVTFTDAERCRAAKCKVMFVVGVNDGVFPGVFMNEGVIRDDERQALEKLGLKMAPDTLSRTFDEDFIVYATLTHPGEKVYVSYPMSDNTGGSLAPSGLIKKIKTLFPEVIETESVVKEQNPLETIVTPGSALSRLAEAKGKEREGEKLHGIWIEVGNRLKADESCSEKYKMIERAYEFVNNSETLSDKNLDSLYKKEVYTSVSRLETYRKCPFMYYAKYILKAEPRENTEFRSVDTGTVMHGVIEKISLQVKEQFGSWKNVDNSWLEENIVKIADIETEILKKTLDVIEPRQLWAIMRLKEAVKMSVFAVAKQLQSGEFIPMGYEISFDDEGKYSCIEIPVNGKKIKLRGKIDRGDVYVDQNGKKYIRIVDYKSGQRDFKIENLYYGMNLQLAVYLDSLTSQENAVSAGMLYVRLFDPIASVDSDISGEEAEKALEKERKTSGLLIADAEIVKKMDEALEKGENTYLPVKLKKDGEFDRYSKIATYEQFEAMNKYVRKTVEKMSREMLKGNTSVMPYKLNNETPCDFCEYKKLCHFDPAHGNRYNYLEKINSDEAWEIILKEGK